MKILLILFFMTFSIFADENIVLKQQNVLHVKKIIENEEKIALNFEKYILENYKIPTMSDLKNDEYLGSNFSLTNRFGDDIDFISSSDLKLKYSITKDEVDFKNLLYTRELYRNYTTVEEVTKTVNSKKMIDTTRSYVLIKLQSNTAKNLFNILKTSSIESSCSDTLVSKYCNVNETSIRWYNSVSQWIEYDKNDFENGNITIQSSNLLNDNKLKNLPVGTNIFIFNGSKYVKLMNNLDGSLNILKAD